MIESTGPGIENTTFPQAAFLCETIAEVLAERIDQGIEVSGDVCGVPFKFTLKSKPKDT